MKRWIVATLAIGSLCAGCAEVNSAVEQVDTVTDRASTCTKALGLADFNVNQLSPRQLQEQAGRKAAELRELASQTAEIDVQQALLAAADSYVALERRRAEELGNLTDWARHNTDIFDRLRRACLP